MGDIITGQIRELRKCNLKNTKATTKRKGPFVLIERVMFIVGGRVTFPRPHSFRALVAPAPKYSLDTRNK